MNVKWKCDSIHSFVRSLSFIHSFGLWYDTIEAEKHKPVVLQYNGFAHFSGFIEKENHLENNNNNNNNSNNNRSPIVCDTNNAIDGACFYIIKKFTQIFASVFRFLIFKWKYSNIH